MTLDGAYSTGLWVAVKTALLAANSEIIIIVDCDYTYPAEQVPEFVEFIDRDIVSRSRLGKSNKNMKPFNKFGNKLIAAITTFFYGINLTDVTIGMRAYRREVIQNIK